MNVKKCTLIYQHFSFLWLFYLLVSEISSNNFYFGLNCFSQWGKCRFSMLPPWPSVMIGLCCPGNFTSLKCAAIYTCDVIHTALSLCISLDYLSNSVQWRKIYFKCGTLLSTLFFQNIFLPTPSNNSSQNWNIGYPPSLSLFVAFAALFPFPSFLTMLQPFCSPIIMMQKDWPFIFYNWILKTINNHSNFYPVLWSSIQV